MRNNVFRLVAMSPSYARQDFGVGTRVYWGNGTYTDYIVNGLYHAPVPVDWKSFSGPTHPIGKVYANWIEYGETSTAGVQMTGWQWVVTTPGGRALCRA